MSKEVTAAILTHIYFSEDTLGRPTLKSAEPDYCYDKGRAKDIGIVYVNILAALPNFEKFIEDRE